MREDSFSPTTLIVAFDDGGAYRGASVAYRYVVRIDGDKLVDEPRGPLPIRAFDGAPLETGLSAEEQQLLPIMNDALGQVATQALDSAARAEAQRLEAAVARDVAEQALVAALQRAEAAEQALAAATQAAAPPA
jgi:hypothetical protein